MYVDIRVLRSLKEELAWAIDKWLWINECYSYIVKKLKNEDVLNLKQYCMHCYVILSSIF